MSVAARLRVLPRAHRLPHRAPVRSFHSPFVVLNASSPLTTPPPSTATPVYEKQEDNSSEPHLSSSGTRTYVVSEPDPANTPYEVPSGAYSASAPYMDAPKLNGLYTSVSSTITHPYTTLTVLQHEAGVGASAAVRSGETTGEASRTRGSSHNEVDSRNSARTKSGKF